MAFDHSSLRWFEACSSHPHLLCSCAHFIQSALVAHYIENKSASSKVVISNDFDENLIISGPDNRAKIPKKQHL
jgi:hypothetical protein